MLIDRYIYAASSRPFAITLLMVLVALLLERVLRFFDLFAQTGATLPMIVELSANLVPYYLGLALPASFFVSVFLVAARLSDDNELDALMAAGMSIPRITRPFFVISIVFMFFSLALFGFIQPYSRYVYRAVYYAASNAVWDGRAQPATFVDTPRGLVLSADDVDPTGTQLTGVFLRQTVPAGERITTALTGRLAPGDVPGRLTLFLHHGQSLEDSLNSPPRFGSFETLAANLPYDVDTPPFRARGESERELTLTELLSGLRNPNSMVPHSRLAAEFNGRIARALSLPLLPLLAMPLAMVAKRGRRGAGLALAGVILFAYHHSLQFGESLADTGRVHALPALWIPFAVFMAFCLWLFMSSLKRPGDNPFSRVLERLSRPFNAIGGYFRRKAPV
ncbi:MAG: LptF/LptG family permease [Parvibaculaceae bacterium]|nr:LptF/LptG family permease [Parvibaculaceae bacterium]